MKRIFTILSIILLTGAAVHAQSSRVANVQDPIVKFYPNPASTVITFDLQKSNDKSLTLQVINMLGRRVYELPNVPAKKVLNLNEFNRGVYIVQLRDSNGKIVYSGKFQVAK